MKVTEIYSENGVLRITHPGCAPLWVEYEAVPGMKSCTFCGADLKPLLPEILQRLKEDAIRNIGEPEPPPPPTDPEAGLVPERRPPRRSWRWWR